MLRGGARRGPEGAAWRGGGLRAPRGAGTSLDTGGRPTPCARPPPSLAVPPACHLPTEPPEAPLSAPCLLGPPAQPAARDHQARGAGAQHPMPICPWPCGRSLCPSQASPHPHGHLAFCSRFFFFFLRSHKEGAQHGGWLSGFCCVCLFVGFNLMICKVMVLFIFILIYIPAPI